MVEQLNVLGLQYPPTYVAMLVRALMYCLQAS
jgi:hypothetical protein